MGSINRKVSAKAKRELSLGTVCCNCGKECGRSIQYHHIIPLEYGGNDVITNIVPLCDDCHSMQTWGFVHKKAKRTGRKRKITDEDLLDSVFTRYVNKELSEIDARKELGTGSKIKDMVQFKEWADKNGIDLQTSYGRSGRWYKRKTK